MNKIRVLPEIIANRIAAGEVVERPSSIVKELVENSLDAGARRVEVEIRHGGKSFIRVADDGTGMPPEDAKLAFQRHATSKIETAEDLDAIGSFGFRGEALPSIAAVSRTKMMTRTRPQSSGWEIVIEGGQLRTQETCSCSFGTVLEVRDLFFNTPARRKFLRSETTEFGHIQDFLSQMALSRLDVQFVLKNKDKVVFDLVPSATLRERAAALWGRDKADKMLEIKGSGAYAKVEGLIGKPELARSNRQSQSFFINGRWIKSVALSYAFQDGYHGLMMHGQYPVGILFIFCDLKQVDVNVHPTKQEVRISQEPQIKALIRKTVEECLTQSGDLSPSMKLPAAPLSRTASGGRGVSSPGLPGFLLVPSPASSRAGTDFELQTAGTIADADSAYEVPAVAEEAEAVLAAGNSLQVTKILGQIHGTFIVAETAQGMLLIDQHAAHERVRFEALMKSFRSGKPAQQKLLIEEILEINPRQAEWLEKTMHDLKKFGFDLEAFGPAAYVLRAVPAVLSDANAAAMLRHFLDEKEDGRLKTHLDRHQEEAAALIACKRQSVKAHELISAASMKSLVAQLGHCENPFNCPHGRPTTLKYSFSDLEKQFKRKL